MYKQSKPLKQPANYEHGFNYALFLLNLSAQTEGELKAKMRRRGYVTEVVEKVVERLKELDYINDQKYAESYLNTLKTYKTYGYYLIRQKLLLKKLPSSIVEAKLRSQLSVEDEYQIMLRYLGKELGLSYNSNTEELTQTFKKLGYEPKQKLIKKMAARGFRMEVIMK